MFGSKKEGEEKERTLGAWFFTRDVCSFRAPSSPSESIPSSESDNASTSPHAFTSKSSRRTCNLALIQSRGKDDVVEVEIF